MAERVASLYAEIGAKTDGLKAGLAQAKSGLAGFAANAKQTLAGAGEAWAQLATPINQTIQILGQVGAAAQQAYAFVSEGTQLARTEQQFGALAGSIGSTSDALLGELKTATRGTISDFKLMESATSIMSLGLADTSEETVRLASLVGKLGWDMNQVTLTLANQSTMRLDSLGLSVEDVTGRIDALKEAGYSADQAFKFAILEAGEEKVKLLGDAAETTAGKLAIMEANAANFGDSFKKAFSEELIANVNSFAGGVFEAEESASSFGETLGKIVTNVSFLGFLRFAKGEIADLGNESKNAEGKISGMGGVIRDLPKDLQAAERSTEDLADVAKVYRADVIAASDATDGWAASLNTTTTYTDQAIRAIHQLSAEIYQETSPAYAELQDRITQTNAEYDMNAQVVRAANLANSQYVETVATATGYIAQSAEAMAAYNAATGDYVTQALDAESNTISFGDSLYASADAAGANAAALVGIKLALGEITPAQAEYLLQQAAMTAKATEFGQAIAAGTMTIEEAVTGLQNFATGLEESDVNINTATGSVYLFNDSITASSASTENLLDKMGMITDVNATVTVDTGDAEARVTNLYNKLREIGDPAMPSGGGGSSGGGSAGGGGGGYQGPGDEGGGNIPQYASGGDFVVPAGFPMGGPGMPIGVHSGERVQVTPAGQSSGNNITMNLYVTATDGGATVSREFNYMKGLLGV